MPVMDSKGNLFDERRKTQRRKSEKKATPEKRVSDRRSPKKTNKK